MPLGSPDWRRTRTPRLGSSFWWSSVLPALVGQTGRCFVTAERSAVVRNADATLTICARLRLDRLDCDLGVVLRELAEIVSVAGQNHSSTGIDRCRYDDSIECGARVRSAQQTSSKSSGRLVCWGNTADRLDGIGPDSVSISARSSLSRSCCSWRNSASFTYAESSRWPARVLASARTSSSMPGPASSRSEPLSVGGDADRAGPRCQ